MGSIGYYTVFQLPADLADADDLRALLQELWSYRYSELYEDADDGRPVGQLANAVDRLLSFLLEHDPALAHHRLLYLGWALALASVPTIEGWAPDDTRPQFVLEAIHAWLEEQRQMPLDVDTLFPLEITGSQALNEARDVFANLVRALVPEAVLPALHAILDDCLEGYAVFPGSEGRRDLFNWVLLEVIPAAWSLHLPEASYTFRWPWPPPNQA
jgi:hypothetical protein